VAARRPLRGRGESLNEFFARTGYPRAPRYYLIKWHTDWIRKYGVDGFRADTVKHVQPQVWKELLKEASIAFEDWKKANPDKKLSDDKFYSAEVYNYNIAEGLAHHLGGGDRINYYQAGFNGMINFGLVQDAKKDYESIFSSYSNALHGGPLDGYSVLNYLDSHDDGAPFDASRKKPFESANKLLLAPGAAQIYYGDETARKLDIAEATGDAKLRSFMNWDELEQNGRVTATRSPMCARTGPNWACSARRTWRWARACTSSRPSLTSSSAPTTRTACVTRWWWRWTCRPTSRPASSCTACSPMARR
jgi:alpha-amylase